MPSYSPVLCYFYPRSPCGERPWAVFLSCNYPFISIHALLAESDVRVCEFVWGVSISIHALLAESDQLAARDDSIKFVFLSTLSLRRATNGYPHTRQRGAISIHALLAESDKLIAYQSGLLLDFYPRSPCGERQTRAKRLNRNITLISIHALLAESDLMISSLVSMSC